jgi:hypothetical protein
VVYGQDAHATAGCPTTLGWASDRTLRDVIRPLVAKGLNIGGTSLYRRANEESWFVMNDAPSTRPPPQIIRVPFPERGGRIALLIVAFCFIACACALGVFVNTEAGLLLGGVFLVEFVIVGVFLRRQAKERRRLWAEILREHPGLEAEPIVAALLAVWRRKPRLAAKVPEVGDRRFEPYIVTAGELLGRRLWFAPIAAILLTVWFLQVFHVISARGFSVSGFLYFIVVGVAVGGTWLWRTGICPTYIRAAPGIIEFMEYRIGSRKPIIRSYRMEPGTLVTVTSGVKQQRVPISVALSCEGHRNTLAIGQMKNKTEAMERIWWALLSTAPIPKMDEEQLVG